VSDQFKGTINVDIRDSVPDWSPFEPPKAPDGAANVVYIVLDDVGFSAMSSYGGPIETPNIDRIAADGGAVHAVAHDGAVLADPVVPADRAQPHP
jgi:Sulfatase